MKLTKLSRKVKAVRILRHIWTKLRRLKMVCWYKMSPMRPSSVLISGTTTSTWMLPRLWLPKRSCSLSLKKLKSLLCSNSNLLNNSLLSSSNRSSRRQVRPLNRLQLLLSRRLILRITCISSSSQIQLSATTPTARVESRLSMELGRREEVFTMAVVAPTRNAL